MNALGQCSKHYPKAARSETELNVGGYPAYRRREIFPPTGMGDDAPNVDPEEQGVQGILQQRAALAAKLQKQSWVAYRQGTLRNHPG